MESGTWPVLAVPVAAPAATGDNHSVGNQDNQAGGQDRKQARNPAIVAGGKSAPPSGERPAGNSRAPW